ncbi:MAG: HlyD family efflux transporter periplasmic adaptor subunit [Thermoanaerobaculia bacterium]|nr:HlyD family efflux transporter periplasmic adaptor subunit [Thermoanaerobaculia bacterium]
MSAVPRARPALAAETGAATLALRLGAPGERPELKKNLVVRRQVQMGEARFMVKNRDRMKYYIFPDYEWRLIELFDGTRTRAGIVDDYNATYSFDPIELPLVLEYEEMLRKIDLVEQSVAEKSLQLLAHTREARKRAADEKAEGFNPFFLLFNVLDPEEFLKRTVKYVRWIWTPPVAIAWALAVAWTVGVFVLHWEPIFTGTYELYAFLRKPFLDAVYFFFLLSFIGFFHEFGHAYAVKIYGGEVHDIGIALLYFTPAFYCDTTDALLFPNKWHRLWVTTAGIYVEGFVCAGATALWVASYPDTLLHDLAFKTMLFTGISTIFFNINPLVKIDGYYALTSVLEMPDLREDAFRYIGLFFQKHVLRLQVEVPVATKRRRRIYWIYGPLALAYIGVIMSFIASVLSNLFHKIAPDFALALLVLSLGFIFKKRLRLITRTARLVHLDKKEYVMSSAARPRLFLAVGALFLVLFVPFRRETITAEGVLSPVKRLRIEAPEAGTIEAILVQESDTVKEGDILFRMSSSAAEAAVARFRGARDRSTAAAGAALVEGTANEVYAGERRALSAEAGLRSEAVRALKLTVKSPITGLVLTPRIQDLQKRFVAAGSLLAEVGDCRQLVAALPVSERLLDELQEGAPVKAYVLQRPLGAIHGIVKRISPATAGQPKTAAEGAEPALPTALPDRFVALAFFDNPGGTLRPGSTIRAKIAGRRHSFAARGWRVLRRWLRTVFW